MAAIVRVKRSRVEEPADTLFMLCKRIKLEGADEGEEVKSVFKFAGTVNAKVFREYEKSREPSHATTLF